MLFEDRVQAGELLAAKLLSDPLIEQAEKDQLLVLSIPRGGAVVGATIARVLDCDHDVIVVKKIGFPGHEEMAIGAVAEDGLVILDERFSEWHLVDEAYLKQAITRVKARIAEYIQKFRDGRPLDVKDKIVIVVDDGIATGETMKAAVKWLKSRPAEKAPRMVMVAVPVCSPSAAAELSALADKFVSLYVPEYFWAVGQFYREFSQVSDAEVLRILQLTRQEREKHEQA